MTNPAIQAARDASQAVQDLCAHFHSAARKGLELTGTRRNQLLAEIDKWEKSLDQRYQAEKQIIAQMRQNVDGYTGTVQSSLLALAHVVEPPEEQANTVNAGPQKMKAEPDHLQEG